MITILGVKDMDENKIYHGSNVTVAEPRIMINGHYKDFGYGIMWRIIWKVRFRKQHFGNW